MIDELAKCPRCQQKAFTPDIGCDACGFEEVELPIQIKNTLKNLGADVEVMLETLSKDIKKMGAVDMAFSMDYIRQLKDLIDLFEKPINIFYNSLRMGALPDAMDAEGVQTVKITNLGTLYITSDVGVTVIKGKTEDSFKWLKSHGLEDIIKRTVNSSTLKATMKVEMGKGTKIPEDIYKITPMSRAAIKKS
jgi:hypothetical protein